MMFELGYLSVCESDYLDDLSTVFDSNQCCDVNCGIWQVRADVNVRIRRSDIIVSSEMRVGCGFKDMADQSDQSHEGSFLTVTS
jgi:Asp-tRNA(Asn)/Glu-tRNA(Gln) amidotransferase B subunit